MSPPLQGDEPRLLKHVLGEVEVPQEAREGCDRPPPHLSVETSGRGLEAAGG
jgi:hypothetical protein